MNSCNLDKVLILNEITNILNKIINSNIILRLDTSIIIGSSELSLNISSLDFVNWLVEIENKFNIEITDEDKTVDSIIQKIIHYGKR